MAEVVSMCDGYEYPWFAAWDLAIQIQVFAHIDPSFAQEQCLMLLRPGIAGPTGAVPAYEFDYSDNNPPLLAWAAYKIFQIEQQVYGTRDIEFLRTIFPRLNRYYTWYMLDADVDGHQLLGKSFLGLDNASIIDRSDPPARVKALYQVDGTAWAGRMALDMMKVR
jgi:hypothetical protein